MSESRESKVRELIPIFIMMGLFILVYSFSLSLVHPFQDAGMKTFEDPDNPANVAIILVILLVTTIIILIIAKYWRKWLIQAIILFAVGYTSFYILLPILALLLPDYFTVFLSFVIALIITLTLWKYPEWYIIDLCGVIISTGSVVIFGISLGILPVIILL
ncbi:MAG: presenilin family intramembrane aspartyl protease PSH, partial [Candidatus Thermoplasmatota archaeon]